MAAKKHTPWYIEIREVDFDNNTPLFPGSCLEKSHQKAIFTMVGIRKLCRQYNIWHKRQMINITKSDVPIIFRIYFNSEEDLNTIKILR